MDVFSLVGGTRIGRSQFKQRITGMGNRSCRTGKRDFAGVQSVETPVI